MRYLLPLLLLAGCQTFTAPPSTILHPSVEYVTWWDSITTCAHISGDFSRITWFVTANRFSDANSLVAGEWMPPHTIYLAGLATEDSKTVRHEMLHDLLTGDAGHTSPLWDACSVRF